MDRLPQKSMSVYDFLCKVVSESKAPDSKN